ncbi:MAG: glycosyltransferase family 4 protein [Chlamydiia bacterium]|nr:glycosyltransferase family 4 protein [Chlamydiia bacterium]
MHLEASTGWGGQEIRILRESVGMRARGHEVILAVMAGAELGKRARQAGLTVYELDFRRSAWWHSFWRLCRIFKQHAIEVVNTHSSLDAWLGGLVARWVGCKVVRTRHLSTPIKRGLNSRLLYGKLADFVVTTCESIVETIVRQSGKERRFCRSVPTGIAAEHVDVKPEEVLAFRKQWGFSSKEFVVGTACVMRSWKGIQDLLLAADRLRHIADLRWVVIGGGHAETYHAMAKELHLGGKVLLQAAYLRRPLIATATGGLGEVCLDQITGILVSPFRSDQVAEAVLRLKESRSERERLGDRARVRVVEHFLWQQTLDNMEQIFLHVVGNSRAH